SVVFDHPTLRALSEHLAGRLGRDAGPAAPAHAAPPDAPTSEPIAIVGIGCRFPGGVSTPEALWRLLHDGVDPIREVPPERFALDAWYDSAPGTPGKTYCREGGFLDDVEGFDAAFFHIPAREAEQLDPQQRLLLEVSWEALERAGQA